MRVLRKRWLSLAVPEFQLYTQHSALTFSPRADPILDWPRTFDKVLVANRGEIACRVIRTCKNLGIKTVAVFSEQDERAKHVQLSDEAYCIGGAAAKDSYLKGDKILEVARLSGAQAIHPGYGFLSENVHFAQLCQEQGIEFIGPPVKAIDAMGSKSASKKIMTEAGVPVVPGYHGDNQDPEFLYEKAKECGFPIMLKAVLGGGGKGMRIVLNDDKEEFMVALESAKREAKSSFNDDRVLLERYIVRPRHIEFQVFGDKYGNVIHLLERDCSVQRRHQKVLEEAPGPTMTPEERRKMGEAAVAAAKAVGYYCAGTVEFIVDADTGEYFFMEMNTRLQVEHPATEMITKLDLVQLQLHVSAGHKLPLKESFSQPIGHAIEARIYSEDPANNFFPGSGNLEFMTTPANSSHIRIDSGVRPGDQVSIFYDPMIAKLVAWGENRDEALRRIRQALLEYKIVGLPTNVEFLINAVAHPLFVKGGYDTSFIEKNKTELIPSKIPQESVPVYLALATYLSNQKSSVQRSFSGTIDSYSLWNKFSGFRVNSVGVNSVLLKCGDKTFEATISFLPDGSFSIQLGDEPIRNIKPSWDATTGLLETKIDSKKFDSTGVISKSRSGEAVTVFHDGSKHTFQVVEKTSGRDSAGTGSGSSQVPSPMPGKIVKVHVKAGDSVEAGDPVIVMEAMKMELVIRAPSSGVVDSVSCQEGDFVQSDAVLVQLQQ